MLLAKLFTRPSNVLALDEPTNDLDVETLDLLEDLLQEYAGTLFLVSHDREFLNNVVTSTLVLAGDGAVQEYVGDYDDWVRQAADQVQAPAAPKAAPAAIAVPARPSGSQARPKKLTFKEARELEALLERISALEGEQDSLHRTRAPGGYRTLPIRSTASSRRGTSTLRAKRTYPSP